MNDPNINSTAPYAKTRDQLGEAPVRVSDDGYLALREAGLAHVAASAWRDAIQASGRMAEPLLGRAESSRPPVGLQTGEPTQPHGAVPACHRVLAPQTAGVEGPPGEAFTPNLRPGHPRPRRTFASGPAAVHGRGKAVHRVPDGAALAVEPFSTGELRRCS